MQALRVEVSGAVTSFRYPHFMQGTQPTYDMPPPATLYGHVCSALGELVDPGSFSVAIRFTCEAVFTDYEHTHFFGREAKLSPTRRQLLFAPRLTLYIDRPDWEAYFRSPRYVVTLGRSQDLMSYDRVQIVTLQRNEAAYLEHTLIPLNGVVRASNRVACTMPRYIDSGRNPTWGQYGLIRMRQPAEIADRAEPLWIDPDSLGWNGLSRAVVWLSFH